MQIAPALVWFATAALAGCVHTQSPARRIEEAGYVTVGGIEQWVTIRGDDSRKPVVLLLHGGPGDVQSPYVATYAPYEKEFILVQWDQRGAGRTFEKHGEGTPELSLERQIADGIDLGLTLRRRFPSQKLILLAHSWGTIVAAGIAQQQPHLFDAYVGTGQVASRAGVFHYQLRFLLATAEQTGDGTLQSRLNTIAAAPDPTNLGQYFGIIAPGVRSLIPAPDKAWLDGTPDRLKANANVAEPASRATSAGVNFSAAKLIGALTHADLTQTAPQWPVPYCVIQGRLDLNAPTSVVEPYFAAIRAPEKRMTVIESAGHFALATHPAEFISALNECPGI